MKKSRLAKPILKPIFEKLEKLEKEINDLKFLLFKSSKKQKNIVSLRGILKGLKTDEKDIEKAKSSLFSDIS